MFEKNCVSEKIYMVYAKKTKTNKFNFIILMENNAIR